MKSDGRCGVVCKAASGSGTYSVRLDGDPPESRDARRADFVVQVPRSKQALLKLGAAGCTVGPLSGPGAEPGSGQGSDSSSSSGSGSGSHGMALVLDPSLLLPERSVRKEKDSDFLLAVQLHYSENRQRRARRPCA